MAFYSGHRMQEETILASGQFSVAHHPLKAAPMRGPLRGLVHRVSIIDDFGACEGGGRNTGGHMVSVVRPDLLTWSVDGLLEHDSAAPRVLDVV